MLKYTTKKIIDCYDLDELVKETYGRPFHFQQQDGCMSRGNVRISVPSEDHWDYENDTVPEVVNHHERGVSFKAWLARDPKQPLEGQEYDHELSLWWDRNFYPSLDMVLDDLYEKCLIEEGEYIIEIDW